jgi:hypothetical protein
MVRHLVIISMKQFGITGRNMIEILFQYLREGLRKTMKYVSRDSRCHYRDTNLGPLEYKVCSRYTRLLSCGP